MERKNDCFVVYDDDIGKAKEILGWIGIGMLILESIRMLTLRPWVRDI